MAAGAAKLLLLFKLQFLADHQEAMGVGIRIPLFSDRSTRKAIGRNHQGTTTTHLCTLTLPLVVNTKGVAQPESLSLRRDGADLLRRPA
jgi:hypothetical protein